MTEETLGGEKGEKLKKNIEEKLKKKLEKNEIWELRNWSKFSLYIEEEGAGKCKEQPLV